jgi:hypothetical protein
MKLWHYFVLFLIVFDVVGFEVHQGSPAWSQTGSVNWVGSTQTFNPGTSTQYFVQNYSVVVPRGTFNFTAYVVLRTDLPQLGHNVTIVQDHDGTIYPK